jgi:hypothetical protein
MNDGFWLVMSSAYVDQELAAEFGQMPPSFLPVGTKRLYEYQLERIGRARPVYLTVPETYAISPEDLLRLQEFGAVPLRVPTGISLGEAVIFALNLIGTGPDQPVWILHGDTLVDQLPPPDVDMIGVAMTTEGYSWAEVELDGDCITGLATSPAGRSMEQSGPVACGYFAFSHTGALIRGITRTHGDFIAGIMDYTKEYKLQAAFVDSWYDFGHVQTFFRSRRIVSSARHFNSLRVDGRTARKSSRDTEKIRAEVAWFATVPPSVQLYSARLIDSGEEADGRAFYETEYGYLPTLAELFVFSTLGPAIWSQILQSCKEFLAACVAARTSDPSDPLLRELAAEKTISRLRRFSDETGFDVDAMLRYNGQPLPSLVQIAADLASQIDFGSGRRAHVMHGDFCFSNILYDSRMQRIRVIDPRGFVSQGCPSILGDLRYDLAKLAHSVIGRYDQIIAGRYRLAAPDGNRFQIELEEAPHHRWLEQALESWCIDGIRAGGREVRALCICLFLSMLPLHSDRPDRQRAFLANALRLYSRLDADGT